MNFEYNIAIIIYWSDKIIIYDSSFFGFFLTILFIFASLILFLYEIIKAIKRKELKVYDTNIYSQEMPIIDIDIDQFYFAFGLEYPNTANRYIDESNILLMLKK